MIVPMKRNVIITGAAGFLGSHLMLHHLKKGDNVLGIDNYSSSSPNSEHVKEIRGYDNGVLVKGDICHRSDIGNAHAKFYDAGLGKKFDLIYNFACPASPPIYQSIPVDTLMTCTVGFRNILDVAKLEKAVVVHASTSEVYGDPNVSPQPESYRGCVNSYGPRSCYDEGKRSAEALAYDFLNKHNVDVRLVRIFNTYGPHMDPNDGRVVSNFICQALRHEDLTIYGNGQQTRSFCYVDDLIRAIVAMGNLKQNPGTPINIGNPKEFKVHELADEVIKRLGGRIIRKPIPVDDPTQRCPNISLAKEILKWEPEVDLCDGLMKTIEYFKKVV